jgi:hypothetical protein
MARWLLVRRRRRDGELAFYACYGPAATPLVGLVRVAGTRWAVEEGFKQAKGEVDLDDYDVRKWPGWYRYITLALLAHAFLAVPPRPGQPAAPSAERGALQRERRARPAAADRVRGPAACWSRWCGRPPSSPASYWPGPGGADTIRPVLGAHTTSEGNASAAGVLTDRLGGHERRSSRQTSGVGGAVIAGSGEATELRQRWRCHAIASVVQLPEDLVQLSLLLKADPW